MRVPRPSLILPGTVLAVAIAIFGLVRAQAPQTSPQVNIDTAGLALKGTDPVSYFAVGKPLQGVKRFQSSWGGATYQFISAANKTTFDTEPARFVPKYGGFCAWAASQGYKADADPAVWKIVDGRLYVNYNASVGKTWEANQAQLIQAADQNWQTVQSLPGK